MSPDLRAARVRLLFLDIDGTMTDGRLFMGRDGEFWRAYHVLDGYGLKVLVKSGYTVAIITAAGSDDSIVYRMRELGINHVFQNVSDKLQVAKEVLDKEGIIADNAAYMGDDIPDLEPMRYMGLACAPQTAVPEVLAAAHYVPPRPAGAGAVRDVCELILANRATS